MPSLLSHVVNLSTRHGLVRRLYAAALPAGCLLFAVIGAYGGPDTGGGGVSSIAEREIARRNQLAGQAQELIRQGDEALARDDAAAAAEAYRQAALLLPDAPVYRETRRAAISRYSTAAVRRAGELGTQGRYDEAKGQLDAVLELNPDYAAARRLKAQLADPERFNPSLNPAHIERVQKVSSLLILANGHFDLGEFDKATLAFNEALSIDPYNSAARRGLEKTERAISGYAESARDHARSDLLRKIDEQWADAVPVAMGPGLVGPGAIGGEPVAALGSAREKVRVIILPQVQLLDSTLDEAVQFLTLQARNYDNTETDPARKGVNIVLGTEPGLATKRINLNLTNVPLAYVLQTIAQQAGTGLQIDDFFVRLGSAVTTALVTRTYRVPPGFFTQAPAAAAATGADPFSLEKPPEGLAFARISAPDFLRQSGVGFPEGGSAYYNAANGTMTVRNTAANHELVQTLIDQASTAGVKQVKLKVVMLESDQDNLHELGFDWLLSAFDLSSGVFAAGGTAGNTATGDETTLAQNFPFAPPVPGGGIPVGQNPVTAGNRSGDAAIPANSIDALLAGTLRSPGTGVKAPAVFAASGVFTDPQFQVVMRALNQKKGSDILAAPSVLARSGQRAKVQVVREFPYPTEFEPPEIPQDFGGGGDVDGGFFGGFGFGKHRDPDFSDHSHHADGVRVQKRRLRTRNRSHRRSRQSDDRTRCCPGVSRLRRPRQLRHADSGVSEWDNAGHPHREPDSPADLPHQHRHRDQGKPVERIDDGDRGTRSRGAHLSRGQDSDLRRHSVRREVFPLVGEQGETEGHRLHGECRNRGPERRKPAHGPAACHDGGEPRVKFRP